MTDAPNQNVIAFQRASRAYSHQACRSYRPQMEALPCRTFEDVIEAVRSGRAELAMLPVENYLGDAEAVKAKAEAVANQGKKG